MATTKKQFRDVDDLEITTLVNQSMDISTRIDLEFALLEFNTKHPEYTIYFDVSQNNGTIYSKRIND